MKIIIKPKSKKRRLVITDEDTKELTDNLIDLLKEDELEWIPCDGRTIFNGTPTFDMIKKWHEQIYQACSIPDALLFDEYMRGVSWPK